MSDLPIELQSPEVKKVAGSALQLAGEYETFAVVSVDQYTNGAEHLKRIKAAQKALELERKAITAPMDLSKNAVMKFFKGFSDRLDNAEAHVKRGLTAFKEEQDRIAEEAARIERERVEREEKRLREEARKADEIAAEKERKRLAEEQRKADERADAERKRLAEEAAAAESEEDKRRVAEQEEAARIRREKEQDRIHQDRLNAEADKRERTARAETLESRADAKSAAPVQSAAPKVSGISTRKKWCFEITDPALIPDQYKTIDEKKIGGVVRALKADTNIPGIRVWSEMTMAASSK